MTVYISVLKMRINKTHNFITCTFFVFVQDRSRYGSTKILTLTISNDLVREPQQVSILLHGLNVILQSLFGCFLLDETRD